AGSYIGCNQQRARAAANASASSGAQYRATSNLRIRSGPGTSYRQTGSLSAGQPFAAIGSQGEWVQIAGGGWVNANYVTTY
ncbi:MAG TPA: SH3 domain-containing protein, partial [Brevundimonas sp.]|nr:SH3 domain-containing protein [Brevundimonas sp.]